MDIMCPHCASLDVHKKTVVACRLTPDATGKAIQETRTFATLTAALLERSDWLQEANITHVAMESTGESCPRRRPLGRRPLSDGIHSVVNANNCPPA